MLLVILVVMVYGLRSVRCASVPMTTVPAYHGFRELG
jgi:hypothetical protein